MSRFRAAQPNFSRGELAPALQARFDVDAWNAALRRARNVVILKHGGLSKRPGTELVAEVLDASAPNRLIPFQFSLTQSYALEMGQGYMAPCAHGGRVVEEELAITGISNAPQARVSAAFHGYGVGDVVYLSGIAGGLGDLLNGRAWRITGVTDANGINASFTINADTSTLPVFTAAEGGTNRAAAGPPGSVAPVVPIPIAPPIAPAIRGGGGGAWKRPLMQDDR